MVAPVSKILDTTLYVSALEYEHEQKYCFIHLNINKAKNMSTTAHNTLLRNIKGTVAYSEKKLNISSYSDL